ncbi:bifunctional aspartate transaminase/aspartate 4-decarboxylase [Selenihalanaerobacter shriftii]|uniref:Aminotransferase n=1 Tax=Selenihalanaerobacter shriftii TaxID=142842 RepID=A0A1T4PBU4_9FIRM|nr:bifunctional aspartate transaminase/aspartate 4-decarboxylase [Selenihalanaerobacter shriftii]SJZ88841.1 aspartate 4-decarboxylase [Selenihalanaerobacter shriftii]
MNLNKEALAPGLTYEQELEYMKLSPFEVTGILKDKAENACQRLISQGKECEVLNAGRGNPNFLNTIGRKAFAKLVLFATEMAGKDTKKNSLGWRPNKRRIAEELDIYLKEDGSEEALFLKDAINYAESILELNPNDFVFELTDAALGDFYPDPPIIYPNIGKIVDNYLTDVIMPNNRPAGEFSLFATEGATEAMVYSFKSLKENHIIHPGDWIATITPIFAPYLEIPVLESYKLINVKIKESEDMEWQIPNKELKKLEDERIKILFLVNPTNPTSVGISRQTINKIADLVNTKRQDLIIITDTVYANFVDDFYSLVSVIPKNTLCIYSYSKYFGVTGWRLGVIMLYEGNVIDRLIANHPDDIKHKLNERYGIISTEPEKIKFIDRLEMDSRDVALAHTGGLSGPQQAIMCIFSLFNLMDYGRAYENSIKKILDDRIQTLYTYFPGGYQYLKGSNKTHYYSLINIVTLAKEKYGKDFSKYLTEKFVALDFITKLASERAIICLPGAGFAGPEWTLRVSLANLCNQDYLKIGKAIIETLEDYYKYYQKN